MNKPSPESNNANIIRLEGKVNELSGKFEGQMAVQGENIKEIKESSLRVETTVMKNIEKTSAHIAKLYVKSDKHGVQLAGQEERLRGHEQLCDHRNTTVQKTLEEVKDGVKETVSEHMDELKTALAEAKQDKKDTKADWKWVITVICLPIIWELMKRI